jgi:protein involved in polysaccharide export with SLBB domain
MYYRGSGVHASPLTEITMVRITFLCALICILVMPAIAETALVKRDARYRLHPSDVLEVDFRLSPEFDAATIPVQPDGFITIPDIGDVKVANLTLVEATEAIKHKASERLNNPEVTVELKQFQAPYFIVGGQVATPGKIEIHGHVTAVQAVQLAGGLKEGAKTNQLLLIRQIDDQNAETKVINYRQILKHYQADEDVELQAGDMLYVPQTTLTKITPYIKLANLGLYFNPLNP